MENNVNLGKAIVIIINFPLTCNKYRFLRFYCRMQLRRIIAYYSTVNDSVNNVDFYRVVI